MKKEQVLILLLIKLTSLNLHKILEKEISENIIEPRFDDIEEDDIEFPF